MEYNLVNIVILILMLITIIKIGYGLFRTFFSGTKIFFVIKERKKAFIINFIIWIIVFYIWIEVIKVFLDYLH